MGEICAEDGQSVWCVRKLTLQHCLWGMSVRKVRLASVVNLSCYALGNWGTERSNLPKWCIYKWWSQDWSPVQLPDSAPEISDPLSWKGQRQLTWEEEWSRDECRRGGAWQTAGVLLADWKKVLPSNWPLIFCTVLHFFLDCFGVSHLSCHYY